MSMAPPALDRVVRTCLEKDPDYRWQSATDLARELTWITKESVTGASDSIRRKGRQTSPIRSIVVAGCGAAVGLVLGAVLLGTLARRWVSAPADRPIHVQVSLAPADSVASTDAWDLRVGSRRPSRTALALSPDGRLLVFAGTKLGKQQLFVRALDSDKADPIPGTEGAEAPFFSPDARWIGFWAPSATGSDPSAAWIRRAQLSQPGRLRRVAVSGGPVQDVVAVDRQAGASWGDGDAIVFSRPDGIYRVRATRGQPERLTQADPTTTEHILPRLLPGGRVLLFTILGPGADLEGASVVAHSLETGKRSVLAENAADGRLVAGRYLLFMRAGTLLAAPFDITRLALASPPVGILSDVMQAYNARNTFIETGAGQFVLSDTGHLAYLEGGIFRDPETTLTWFDRRGSARPVDIPDRHGSWSARLSRGLERAVTLWNNRTLTVHDFKRGQSWRLPFSGRAGSPVWTPDEHHVVFKGVLGDRRALYRIPADGSGSAAELIGPLPDFWPACWSADGEELLLVWSDRETGLDIVKFSVRDRQIRPVLRTRSDEAYPALSPDGRWLAYVSVSGAEQPQVYVSPYPSMKDRQQVSISRGTAPVWASKSGEILYTQGIGEMENRRVQIMSVSVTGGAQLALGKPRMLFEKSWSEFGMTTHVPAFAVTPDGQRLLGHVGGYTHQPPPSTINLITNWVEELRAKVEGGALTRSDDNTRRVQRCKFRRVHTPPPTDQLRHLRSGWTTRFPPY
jgi:serine/threonine-protein kinase